MNLWIRLHQGSCVLLPELAWYVASNDSSDLSRCHHPHGVDKVQRWPAPWRFWSLAPSGRQRTWRLTGPRCSRFQGVIPKSSSCSTIFVARFFTMLGQSIICCRAKFQNFKGIFSGKHHALALPRSVWYAFSANTLHTGVYSVVKQMMTLLFSSSDSARRDSVPPFVCKFQIGYAV